MFTRALLMLAAVATLTACSSDEEAAVDTSMPAATGGLAGSEYGTAGVNGVTPGTQQDLVVNVGDRVFYWALFLQLMSVLLRQWLPAIL